MNINEIKSQAVRYREELIRMIDALPKSAEGVKMINNHCATVSLSTIAKNNGILSPSYYLALDAIEQLKKLVMRTPIENLAETMEKVIAQGYIRGWGTDTWKDRRITFNATFLEELKKQWASFN